MLSPRRLLVVLSAMLAGLASLASILSLTDQVPAAATRFAAARIETPLWAACLAFLAVGLAAFAPMNAALFRERAQRKNAEDTIRLLRKKLRSAEIESVTDLISGLPNSKQFENDIQQMRQDAAPGKNFQVCLIDLENFRMVNQRWGYETGDEIIEYFADTVSNSMRRNEEIYKLPFNDGLTTNYAALADSPDHAHMWQRAYRKYPGGDEFLFLLEGAEEDALGFLVRLRRNILAEMNAHVQEQILGSTDWSLNFTGTVVPVMLNDDVVSVLQRVSDGMRKASQKGRKTRVYWTSKRTPDDFEDGSWKHRTYADAVALFSEPPLI